MGLTKKYLHSNQVNLLADMAKVLSHPARVAILNYIGDCDGCLCTGIAEHIGLSQPTTSQHLEVIRKSGLLDSRVEGNSRYYTINTQRLSELKSLFVDFFSSTQAKCCP